MEEININESYFHSLPVGYIIRDIIEKKWSFEIFFGPDDPQQITYELFQNQRS